MNPAPPNVSGGLAVGARFHGRYRVVRELGSGGMGTVYEVIDEPSGAPRALKVMHASLARRSAHRARFEQEARVTSNVDSEHVVRVHDAGVADETPFIVMELLRGRGLDAILRERVRMSPDEVCALLSDVAQALDHTHGAGIVHRDLKPENLFVTARDDGSPCVKVLDFGVAKIFKDAAAPLTRTVGTPLFMSPEQIRGDGDVGPQADVYGLVQVAYDLLVGEPYWSEESRPDAPVLSLMVKVLAGPVEPASLRALRRAGVALPTAFDAWFARGTAAAPAQRFARASQAVAELAEIFAVAPPARFARTFQSAPKSSAFDAAGPTLSPDAALRSALATGPTRVGHVGASATWSAAHFASAPTRVGHAGESAPLHATRPIGAGPTRLAPAVPRPTQVSHFGSSLEVNAAPELATMASAGATRPFEGPPPISRGDLPTYVGPYGGPSTSAHPPPTPHASAGPSPAPHHAHRAPSRRAWWPWAVGAVVAIAAVAITAAVLLTGRSKKSRATDDDARNDRPADDRTSSRLAAPSAPASPCAFASCAPLPFADLSAVPADQVLTAARALATSIYKDAALVNMTASGLWTRGNLDLRGTPSPPLHFSFNSASSGDVNIMVHDRQLVAITGGNGSLGSPAPALGCTLADLAASPLSSGMGERATIYLMATWNTPWHIRISDDHTSVAFDVATCKAIPD